MTHALTPSQIITRGNFVIGSDEMWKHMIKHGAPVP
uniref:Uncharacterized protein n=1 Tax=Manihot esculenta TaxID=3983 RepID=A0A2C9VGR2_MANES